MSSPRALSRAFLDQIKPPRDGWVASVELEEHLQGVWAAARDAWPGVEVAPERFVSHLASRLPEPEPQGGPQEVLGAINTVDLYLAAACTEGQPAALRRFEQAVLSRVPAFLANLQLSLSQVEEVRQMLSEKLLVAPAGQTPTISEYAGRGALTNWVRAAAIRTALSLRRDKDEQPENWVSDTAERLLLVPGTDPELEYIKARYRDLFKNALEQAIASLPSEQRSLLHMYFIGGLKTAQIGSLLQVNQSTIVRRLANAREEIMSKMRGILQEQLHLSASEFASLLRLVQSQLDISLSKLL
jgi:RNA polymerase sigma-70 factor (ECF subfamily)